MFVIAFTSMFFFLKEKKGSFLKHQEYKKRRNPVLLPKCLCLFKNLASWKQMLSTVSLIHFFSCCCLFFKCVFWI